LSRYKSNDCTHKDRRSKDDSLDEVAESKYLIQDQDQVKQQAY